MKTAIITGASSGLGTAFVHQLRAVFPEIERLWLVARRRERLEALSFELGEEISVCVLPLDLCTEVGLVALRSVLGAEKPEVCLLVNCAGVGYLGNVDELETAYQTHMTNLNVTALTAVTSLILPFMAEGGHIVNVSSVASFCPNARMTVYSATKAYVSAFTRGLGVELRPRHISATAVCPGPMDTEFLALAGISGNSKKFDRIPHLRPEKVARKALKAAKAGKAVCTPGMYYKFFRLVSKILPQKWVVNFVKT